jgi:hypothetical protein
VWRLDRWGSSVTDLLATPQELEHLGVGFMSPTEAQASSRELSRTIHQTGEAPLCVNAVPPTQACRTTSSADRGSAPSIWEVRRCGSLGQNDSQRQR